MTPMTTTVRPPESHRDLLEKPLFAHLATRRPDGGLQSNVTWYVWDGEFVKLSLTKPRQRFRNLEFDPHVALSILDPDDPYRYLEVRGVVVGIEDDDEKASFCRSLQIRYDNVNDITDAAVRVIVSVRPTRFFAVTGGSRHE